MTPITSPADYQAKLRRIDAINKLLATNVAFPESLVSERDNLEIQVREYGRGRSATPMLDKLRDAKVLKVEIGVAPWQVWFEAIDEWVGPTYLTKDELLALAGELTNLANQMK